MQRFWKRYRTVVRHTVRSLLDRSCSQDDEKRRLTEVFTQTFLVGLQIVWIANSVSQRLFLVGDYYVSVPTKCVIVFSGHLANAATELMKLDHEEPQLTEPYLSKQKKLMVSLCVRVLLDWKNLYVFHLFLNKIGMNLSCIKCRLILPEHRNVFRTWDVIIVEEL